MTPEFISTRSALEAFCDRLAGARQIALDTEFVRVRTYYPVLCLIQVTDGDGIACVDTVALEDFDALMDVLVAHDGGMTIHAARQDFEAIHHRTRRLPAGVWDTQIAAAMLGHGEQVSYAQLAQELLGVELDKSQTRTNWARRPLTEDQLRYAADDVLHLPDIRDRLDERLRHRGRLDWLAEDCTALLDTRLYEPDFDEAWRRCKLKRRLSPVQRGAWKRLCALRERMASRTDRPRRWVLDDTALEELACLRPEDKRAIERLLASGRNRRRLDTEAVRSILAEPVAATDDRGGRPTPEQQAAIDACMKELRRAAEELEVSASLLATRRDIARLANGQRELPLLTGWRRSVVGERLLKRLGGA